MCCFGGLLYSLKCSMEGGGGGGAGMEHHSCTNDWPSVRIHTLKIKHRVIYDSSNYNRNRHTIQKLKYLNSVVITITDVQKTILIHTHSTKMLEVTLIATHLSK